MSADLTPGARALSPGRVLWLAAVLGLVLRLAFGLGYWVGKPLTHDEHEYLSLARSLAQGKGFTFDEPDPAAGTSVQRFGRAPLYPLFLAAVFSVTGEQRQVPTEVPSSVKTVQAVLGAAAVLVLGLVAGWSLGPKTGAVAAALAAVYPPLVWMPAYALSESLYTLLALLAVLIMGKAIDRGGHRPGARTASWNGLAAGVFTGLAALARPVMLFFPLLATLWLLFRHHLRVAVFLGLGTALVIAPWTARNYREYGRVVLIASEGGVTFWTGNHRLATGEGDLSTNAALKRADIDLRAHHPGLSPEGLEPIYYREALSYIVAHPVWWMGLLARKFFYLVVPLGPSYRLHSTRYFATSVLAYTLLVPFAIAGAIRLGGRADQPRALWLLALSTVVALVLYFPQERYRIPVLDPTAIVAAAGWFALRGDS